MTTLTAEQRAFRLVPLLVGNGRHTQRILIEQVIRQAEQAARADERRKVIEECAQAVERNYPRNWSRHSGIARGLALTVRALAKDDSEVA